MFTRETDLAIVEALILFSPKDCDSEAWKRLHLRLSEDIREIRRVTTRTLKSYIKQKLIFDIKQNKFKHPPEVIKKLCYPFLRRLLQIKLTVVETPNYSAIPPDKLGRQKTIVKYLLSKHLMSFDEEIWREMHRLAEEHPEEYHTININNPEYGLTESDRNLLNKLKYKDKSKKYKTAPLVWDKDKWFEKKSSTTSTELIRHTKVNNHVLINFQNQKPREESNDQRSNEIIPEEEANENEKRITPNQTTVTRNDPRLHKIDTIADIPLNGFISLADKSFQENNEVSSRTGKLAKSKEPRENHKQAKIVKRSKIEHDIMLDKQPASVSPSIDCNGVDIINMRILTDDSSVSDEEFTINEFAITIFPSGVERSPSTRKLIEAPYTNDGLMVNGLDMRRAPQETKEPPNIQEGIVMHEPSAVIEISSDSEEFTIPYSFYDDTSSDSETEIIPKQESDFNEFKVTDNHSSRDESAAYDESSTINELAVTITPNVIRESILADKNNDSPSINYTEVTVNKSQNSNPSETEKSHAIDERIFDHEASSISEFTVPYDFYDTNSGSDTDADVSIKVSINPEDKVLKNVVEARGIIPLTEATAVKKSCNLPPATAAIVRIDLSSGSE